MIDRVTVWLRALFQREEVEREMHDEMRAHLDRATERLMAQGMSQDEARLAARREFGNLAVLQEESRDARGVRWIVRPIGDARGGIAPRLVIAVCSPLAPASETAGV